MAIQYQCDEERRREELRRTIQGGARGINGIDFLEVSADQRTLTVTFLGELPKDSAGPPKTSALTAGNVLIEGGVRVTGITVVSVASTHNVLSAVVDRIGDFSTYRLSLVNSRADPTPPDGFDLQLSSVEFSFKVDCPSDFDCPAPAPCLEPEAPAPPIDYLSKDYASFRRLMLDRLAVLAPQWTERNPADVGVAIVEFLAYAADQLSYYQDAVATEAYLGTARRRVSVRRHARLVDYLVDDGTNARTWVWFKVSGVLRGSGTNAVLPPSTMLLSRKEQGSALVQPRDLPRALADDPIVFETLHPVTLLKDSHNAIDFYTWGDRQCCLPKGATRATLKAQLPWTRADLELHQGDALLFEEVVGRDVPHLEADADPSKRHVVRLSAEPIKRTDPLTGDEVLDIAWGAGDALPFSLCLWEFRDSAGQPRGVSVARGNLVLADHGHTFTEAPDPEEVPEQGRYRPTLSRTGLTQRLPYDDQAARAAPASAVLASDVRHVVPAITLQGSGEDWFPQRDLLASDRFAPEFVAELEDDGTATLRFGDGTLGRKPAAGARFSARYRVGNGTAGNIGAESLGRVVTTETAIIDVRNPLPATGGRDPQATEQVRLYAPQAFRTQERAITAADYGAMAQRHPEVNRATASLRWTGSWYTVSLTVDRKSGAPVDEPFREELTGFLEQFRLAGYDLEVDSPHFIALDIVLTVCVQPDYLRAHVEAALLEAFSTSDLGPGRQGFFRPGHFSFGDPVYLSQVIATAMQVPGVGWVDADDRGGKPNRFRRWGEDSHGEIAAGVITLNRLEIARVENDPNAPENGRIKFLMQGGL